MRTPICRLGRKDGVSDAEISEKSQGGDNCRELNNIPGILRIYLVTGRERRGSQQKRHVEQVLGERQVDQMRQRKEGPEEWNVSPPSLNSEKQAPGQGRLVDLLPPPEPAGFLHDNLGCVGVEGRVG